MAYHRDNGNEARILKAHADGLLNREIAVSVGCTHRTVGYWLAKNGLQSNLLRGTPPEPVDETRSRCRTCKQVVPNDQFPFVKGYADGRRLSICRACRRKQARQAIAASPAAYLADRESRMRRAESGRSRRAGIPYELPSGYLLALWIYQSGCCFYTDDPMTMELAQGLGPTAVSVDRVDPTLGYVAGNVVLCRNRINSIKSDVTLDELRAWMPRWHERVIERLPVLVAAVVPIADDRPRDATGRRLPSWVVDRRARLAALAVGASDA